MADDQLQLPLFAEKSPQSVPGVEPFGSGLFSRQQVLKLAGAATLGGAFGLFGSQKSAHARRRKRIAKPALLGANLSGPYNNIATNNGDTDARYAQTFTNTLGGLLTHVQVLIQRISSETSGAYVFSINQVDPSSESPTNTVLTSTKIQDAPIPTNAISTVLVGLSVPVEANQKYALVISRPGSDSLRLAVRSSDPYTGGDLYYSDSQTNAFGSALNSDLVFSTFVIPS